MLFLRNKGLPFIAFTFALSIPFANGINNYVLALYYCLVMVFVFSKHLSLQKSSIQAVMLSTAVLIIPVLWSFFIVDENSDVIIALERRLTFILTPISFLFLPKDDLSKIKDYALKGLTYGAILSSAFLLIMVLSKYYDVKPLFTIDNDLFNYFHTNAHYTSPIAIHPSYFGVYLLSSLAVLFFTTIINFRRWKVPVIGLISLSIIFVNSRIVLGLYILLIILYGAKYFHTRFKNKKTTLISTVTLITIIIFVFFSLFKNTYLIQRATNEVAWELSNQIGTKYNGKGSGDSRLARWGAAIELVKIKPILGHGVSMETTVLKNQYIKMGMNTAAKASYNSHNQFLGFAVESGLIGLAILLFYLILNLILSIKSRDLLSLFFFITVTSICLVENYLIRNAGITFVGFFGALFLFSNFNKLKR